MKKIPMILALVVSKLALLISGGFCGAMIETEFAPELLIGAILGIVCFLGYELLFNYLKKEGETK